MTPPPLTSHWARFLALTLSALFACAMALLPAQSALAHTELLETTPDFGATLSKAPRQVQLVFSENVQKQGGVIVVEASDGTRVDQANTFDTDANIATVQLVEDAPSSQYTVRIRIVSADGHIVTDTFGYRVNLAPAETPAATTEPNPSPVAATSDGNEDSGGSAIWVLGLGAIGLALVAAMIAVAVRGRRDHSD